MLSGRAHFYASKMINMLFSEPGLSRAAISDRLQLDRSTVTNIVSYLIAQNFIEEWSEAEGKRSGRRPVPLRIREDLGYAIGLEIQPELVCINVVTPIGKVIFSSTESREIRADNLLNIIRESVTSATATSLVSKSRLLGIGVGLSGLVDRNRGTLDFSEPLKVRRPIKITQPLRKTFGVPIYVDNDANACCYEILAYREFEEKRNFVFCFCEFVEDSPRAQSFRRISIGTAITLDGKVQYGARHRAGEFRSAFANPDTPGPFAFRQYGEYLRAKSHRPTMSVLIDELSKNIAFIANYLDVAAVYFGGGIEDYRKDVASSLKRAVAVNWLYEPYFPRNIEIRFVHPGEKPVARGAAAIVLRNTFATDGQDCPDQGRIESNGAEPNGLFELIRATQG